MYDNKIDQEKAIIVSVFTGKPDDEISLNELCELADTAGAEVVATAVQNRQSPDNSLYIGSGKLEEIKQLIDTLQANLLIFDDELTPIQLRNLEKATDLRVIDRTMLILDIFALHANSNEGKIQVELAQLQYMLPRLTGKGIEMSRLGGGIGTRGPGETKLETDKRHIRRRIEALKQRLANVEHHRSELRRRRQKNNIPVIAIVGYTNAGKSTLMNRLTNAGVLAQDKLFATLDPTARSLKLPDSRNVILIDTVGLIRRLPHNLIEAFKSTLEEAACADLLLNVCDGTNENVADHIAITRELFSEMGFEDKNMLTVINKCDMINEICPISPIGKTAYISAKTGQGIDDMLQLISDNLPPSQLRLKLQLPFDQLGWEAKIRQNGVVYQTEYNENGMYIDALVDIALVKKLKQFAAE